MISTGELTIDIWRAGSHCRALVSSTRPVNLHQYFIGKSVNQMLQTVPLLFSICRGAQSVAAVRAVEQALDIAASWFVEQQRDRLVSLEMLLEHLWKLLVDLPPLLGLPARQKEMATVSRMLQEPLQQLRMQVCTLAPESGLSAEVGLNTKMIHDLHSLLFADLSEGIITHEQLLQAGLLQTELLQTELLQTELLKNKGIAGDLLRAMDNVDFSTDGGIEGAPQPRLDKQALGKLLTRRTGQKVFDELLQDQSVARLPTESGLLARMMHHPWVKAFAGRALCLRLAALLAETHELLHGTVFSSPSTASFRARLVGAESNAGCAEVETARGLLTIGLAVAEQKIPSPKVTHIQVLAPTDWHFHPKGIAIHALEKLPADDDHLLSQRAELLIKLINPCVGYRLNVRPDADGEECAKQAQTCEAEVGLTQVINTTGNIDYA